MCIQAALLFRFLLPDYYRDAIAWAQQNGVVKGVSSTQFAPESAVSRQDLLTMLYRLCGQPGTSGNLSGFSDPDQISGYARNAVAWAVENGILKGDQGKIMPQATATREQVVAFLVRYIDYAGL